jgi:hypothetical protein
MWNSLHSTLVRIFKIKNSINLFCASCCIEYTLCFMRKLGFEWRSDVWAYFLATNRLGRPVQLNKLINEKKLDME